MFDEKAYLCIIIYRIEEMKDKKLVILATVVAVLVVGLGVMAYLLIDGNIERQQLQELAELDKQEMEQQYKDFDAQYGELQKQIRNDSLIAQIWIKHVLEMFVLTNEVPFICLYIVFFCLTKEKMCFI